MFIKVLDVSLIFWGNDFTTSTFHNVLSFLF